MQGGKKKKNLLCNLIERISILWPFSTSTRCIPPAELKAHTVNRPWQSCAFLREGNVFISAQIYSTFLLHRWGWALSKHKGLSCESIISPNEQFKMLASIWTPPVLSSIHADKPGMWAPNKFPISHWSRLFRLPDANWICRWMHQLTCDFWLTPQTHTKTFWLGSLHLYNWCLF